MGASENSLANLAPPWEPGQSGNPKGRPPKRPQSEANEELLRRAAPVEVVVALRNLGLPANATCAEVLALCLFREGIKGNVVAIKELRESVEGKAMQRIELTSPEDRGWEVRVTYAEEVAPRRVIDVVTEAIETREGIEEEKESNGDKSE